VTIRRYIAAISLLTSVLLGGLIAPLSHFAYMALSDSNAMSMPGMASVEMDTVDMPSMDHHSVDLEPSGDVDLVSSGPSHFECPFAAFFLNQASAVASNDAFSADVTPSGVTCGEVATSVTTRAIPAVIARGPPVFIQISA